MKKRWTEKDKQFLRRLFIEKKLPIIEIALKLGRSTASVNNSLTHFKIPRQRSPKNKTGNRRQAWICDLGAVHPRHQRFNRIG